MTVKEFETYLTNLSDEAYDALIQERIQRLNAEQQSIVLAREVKRKDRTKLINKLRDSGNDPNVHEMVFNAILDMEADDCEHGRSYAKHCLACGEIDHLMFPELFDEYGEHLNDEE